jgi:hypothetical protein
LCCVVAFPSGKREKKRGNGIKEGNKDGRKGKEEEGRTERKESMKEGFRPACV